MPEVASLLADPAAADAMDAPAAHLIRNPLNWGVAIKAQSGSLIHDFSPMQPVSGSR